MATVDAPWVPNRPPDRALIARARRRGSGDAGVASTEMAVLMPALIVIVMLVFQVALFWHAKHAADLAVEEALDATQVADGDVDAAAAGADEILIHAGHLRDAELAISLDDSTGTVTVSLTARAAQIVPFGTWQVTATASGTLETFIAADDR